jgi:hypothetical protein
MHVGDRSVSVVMLLNEPAQRPAKEVGEADQWLVAFRYPGSALDFALGVEQNKGNQ